MSGAIVEPIYWPTDGVMDIDVRFSEGQMYVFYEGEMIASGPSGLTRSQESRMEVVSVGEGLYGPSEYPVSHVRW